MTVAGSITTATTTACTATPPATPATTVTVAATATAATATAAIAATAAADPLVVPTPMAATTPRRPGADLPPTPVVLSVIA